MSATKINIILLGDANVGKTSLWNKYFNKDFNSNYIPTKGIDYLSNIIRQKYLNVKLIVADTSGNDKFQSIWQSYSEDIDGVILVFDVTNKDSFENLDSWLTQLNKYKDDYLYVIVGNKIDLENIREVNSNDVHKNDKFKKIKYFETSVKQNINIRQPFEELTKLILKKLDEVGSIYYNDNNEVKTFKIRNRDNSDKFGSHPCC